MRTYTTTNPEPVYKICIVRIGKLVQVGAKCKARVNFFEGKTALIVIKMLMLVVAIPSILKASPR